MCQDTVAEPSSLAQPHRAIRADALTLFFLCLHQATRQLQDFRNCIRDGLHRCSPLYRGSTRHYGTSRPERVWKWHITPRRAAVDSVVTTTSILPSVHPPMPT